MENRIRSIVISQPPATGNLAFDLWLRNVTNTINGLPISVFSTSTTGPNSRVTAPEGFLGIDVGSSVTKFWVKTSGSQNTGWSHFSHIGGV
jgi:hypothetical protein